MPASFQEVLNSRLFKFIVGEAVDGSASEFSVHEDAIAQLSTPLRTLVKSSPSARVGSTIWKDVNKETFERFVQFAYTGNYSIPKTQKRGVAVPNANGIHPKNVEGPAKSDNAENGVTTQSPSPVAPNGIRARVDSLGSDETSPVEARAASVSEKMEEDGTILNYPIPVKKHKRKKPSKAAIERAERESKEAAIRAEKEGVLELESKPEMDSEPETKPEETQPTETQPPEINAEATPPLGEEKPSEQYKLTVNFKSLCYPLLASLDNYEGTCEPSPVFKKSHNYSNVFLSHASLYLLGDIHVVDSLKALALFKLHKTLCTFELDNENIGDITDLARYAYTGDGKDGDEGIGGLRNLVCQYMAIHAVELAMDARFMNLLAEGGQIVKDFFQFQLQRIQ
ncbi:hypothetical protein DL98DRAFT_517313 [Cadophora sp. DSE1049]|nr:hypothetical protein DL98DRAFT_517313 [Cadophora sp. DSE1049]